MLGLLSRMDLESGEYVKKKKWPKILFFVLAVVVVLGFVFYPRGGNEGMYQKETVKSGTVERYLSFEGNVVAPRSQSFTAPEMAVGSRMCMWRENDQVSDGDRLLKLSNGDVLRSDIDGQVANLFVDPDDAVESGQALIDVVDFTRLEIEVKVDEFDVGAIESGKTAKVTIDALDKTVEGTILRLDKLATKGNDISYYIAHLSFPKEDGVLPGMRVGAKVLSEKAENTLLVDANALNFDENNEPYVLIPDGRRHNPGKCKGRRQRWRPVRNCIRT